METGSLIDRQELWTFEENLAEFVGTKYAVGLNSGYDSLHMKLLAAGIEPGDQLILPSHTFVATASPAVDAGATPPLGDVGPDHTTHAHTLPRANTQPSR